MFKYLNSLSGRLIFWYAGVFALCFVAVFVGFYPTIHSAIHLWTDRELKAEANEFREVYAKSGVSGLTELLRQEEREENGRLLARIIDETNRIIFEIAPGHLAQVRVDDKLMEKARSGLEVGETIDLPDAYDMCVLYTPVQDDLIVQIGLTLQEHELWMKKLSEGVLTAALVALLLSVIAGGFLVRRTLSPLQRMAQTASEISGRSLGQRMPVSGRGDEVDQLALAFNKMLERIDRLVQGLRHVTDTLAHDLRTPITGIRGIAEITLRVPREPEAYRMTLHRIIEQLDRLSSQFTAILDVSEAEAGVLVLQYEKVSLDDLATDVLETFQPVALDKAVRLEGAITPGMIITGDRGRLFQALANLLDNALKYTATGGRIRLTVEPDRRGAGTMVSVADDGVGIAETDLPHIFERYYRGDENRSGPGAGLGLPLVQGVVEAHGGQVTVESELGKGSTFRVFLPRDMKP